uniref:Ecdysis triggering hormone n=1 Tax=Colaphellus bowringi TaxID=561076 RepID=A0A8K1PII0_9CUCU|nr:ecdysis triggering hormone [Colaphellus bowringi]
MLYQWCTFLFVCNYIFLFVNCEEETPNFFLTAAKSVPRIGRSNKANSDFEKFFLKASKSVPRIGRRNENSPMPFDDPGKDMNQKHYKSPFVCLPDPTWSEIADRYEYDPELFSNPAYLTQLEEMLGDDPNVYEWDKVRVKRKVPGRFAMKQNNIYKM